MAEQIYLTARRMCDHALIKDLYGASAAHTVWMTAVIWLQLAAAWSIALYAPLGYSILSFVIISACISAMQLWIHEGAHYSLFKNRRLNDLWTDVFLASPIGVSVGTYRQYHLTHHNSQSSPDDLDRFAFNVDVSGIKQLLAVFLRGLLGLDSYGIITKKYLARTPMQATNKGRWTLALTVLWNVGLITCCVLAGRWYLYFLLWVYPIMGVAVTINSLRSIAEHQPSDFSGPVSDREHIEAVTRTTIPGPFEKWLVYQCNFNYHFEHHLFPGIPSRNLPKLHQHLLERGFYSGNPDLLQRSGVGSVFSRAFEPRLASQVG
jgi:fatty acid desaturase